MMAERQNSGKTEAAIAMQGHGKHISVAMNKHTATDKSFEMVFSMRSVPRLYIKDHQGANSQRSILKAPRAVRQ
jgi:hypothetical protein